MDKQHYYIETRAVNNSTFRRRDFIKSSALLVSAMAINPWTYGNSTSRNIDSVWPETALNYLTPMFILQSTGRLARGSAFFHAGIKHSITTDVRSIVPGNSFHMGGLVPFSGLALLPALVKIKSDLNHGKLDQATSQKLALIIGALCYQSAMKQLESINRFDDKCLSGNPECQVYQDAMVLRSYYSKGKPMGVQNQEEIKSLIGQMIPRTFVRFHTVMPDDDDGAAWVMNTSKWRKQTEAWLGELAAAIAAPDSSKTRKYIEDTKFIDGNDLILKRISAFSKVSEINPEQANHLVEQGLKGSILSKSLARSYRSVMAVNDYIAGVILMSELESKLI